MAVYNTAWNRGDLLPGCPQSIANSLWGCLLNLLRVLGDGMGWAGVTFISTSCIR